MSDVGASKAKEDLLKKWIYIFLIKINDEMIDKISKDIISQTVNSVKERFADLAEVVELDKQEETAAIIRSASSFYVDLYKDLGVRSFEGRRRILQDLVDDFNAACEPNKQAVSDNCRDYQVDEEEDLSDLGLHMRERYISLKEEMNRNIAEINYIKRRGWERKDNE